MKKTKAAPWLFLVTFDSGNFQFDGVGTTLKEAQDALQAALDRHTIEYRCAPGWWGDLEENQQIRVINAGEGCRDSQAIANIRKGVAV